MEQLNRIELRGNIGNVNILPVGERHVAHISVATNYVYKGKDGTPVIETTWHYVTIWENKQFPDFNTISKGANVHVVGRLKSSKYTNSEGIEKNRYEVIANKFEILALSNKQEPEKDSTEKPSANSGL